MNKGDRRPSLDTEQEVISLHFKLVIDNDDNDHISMESKLNKCITKLPTAYNRGSEKISDVTSFTKKVKGHGINAAREVNMVAKSQIDMIQWRPLLWSNGPIKQAVSKENLLVNNAARERAKPQILLIIIKINRIINQLYFLSEI